MYTKNILVLGLAALASAQSSSFGSRNGTMTTVTEVVTALTTYCPEPTVLHHNNRTYVITKATTLTITDCPCTRTYTSFCENEPKKHHKTKDEHEHEKEHKTEHEHEKEHKTKYEHEKEHKTEDYHKPGKTDKAEHEPPHPTATHSHTHVIVSGAQAQRQSLFGLAIALGAAAVGALAL